MMDSWALRGGVLVTVVMAMGCGRIGPGAASRPAATGDAPPGISTSHSTLHDSKPVFDDKGCAVGVGESGSAQQAACRRGK